MEHVHGTKVLQQLIHPNRTQCLPPQELALLKLSERSRRVPASQLTEAELVRPLPHVQSRHRLAALCANESGAGPAQAV